MQLTPQRNERQQLFTIEIIREFSENAVEDILAAYYKGMPWHYDEAKEYFTEMLEDKRCVHVLLRKNGAPMGYVLAKPQEDAAKEDELLEADPDFKSDLERYYIETMEIATEIRSSLSGGRLFFRMIHTLIDEVQNRFKKNKFSMHVRVGSGASVAVQRYFGEMVKPLRRIEKWKFYNGEDAADYIEGTYNKQRRIKDVF